MQDNSIPSENEEPELPPVPPGWTVLYDAKNPPKRDDSPPRVTIRIRPTQPPEGSQ